ncbi:shikimate dehydrogenase [Ruicaihuangia caeni]|uniref:Quinate/shikimate dehydrogenase (NAD(+)) n=1 Tax=Ruicaihuangia caeni TaxID=3042517 RepID=A0AAW6T5Q5_9MICO|nr:shikimate dehydrogenase [Klugiella sp. YN-L-19]MDI2098416.1 shikimate dehydrogenase [Klugiella sp. YN-L-19]
MSRVDESYLVGLIGSGITGSLTPPMHEREAEALGIRYLYRPIDLDVIGRPGADAGELLRAAADLGFNAFNITYPCKQTVSAGLDEVSDDARRLDSVNTVLVDGDRRLIGHNTDFSGFRWALDAALEGAPLGSVVQLGAGGAGAAVAYALLDAGVQRLSLSEVDPAKAEARAASLRALFPDRQVDSITPDRLSEALAEADGLVNATPIGMHHHPGLPLDAALIEPRHWVADVVYRPVQTELLQTAVQRGCRVLEGTYMAVGQAVDSMRLITGIEPDVERMRAHLVEMVAQGL